MAAFLLPLISMIASQAQHKKDEENARQKTGAQLTGDYAASLTHGTNSYRAPPTPPPQDYSALFSMLSKDTGDPKQEASDKRTVNDDLVDPWSPDSQKQKKSMFASWGSGGS